MQRSFPALRTGLRMLEASREPLLVAPAPTIVCISSMKNMAFFIFLSASIVDFRRASNSPLNLVPASILPMSMRKMCVFLSASGTFPSKIFRARPSTIAVFPTPGSPTKTGLFLRLRHNTWIVRSISLSLPTRGSMSPLAAFSIRLTVKCFRASA
ncbi:hypothetical protein MBAV_002503 [Candidatus Magnetobacterium bavaricum]|uniref:Uncharacterized protein n=1 Tax=Candidatus Magnetobacterium bavaricum TaxID=29290 RepID=A0A0F3GXA1_9BACT|nr:hypothetical protein MBAV_002503 [Candidatus Magnetobacterium bavaricum]